VAGRQDLRAGDRARPPARRSDHRHPVCSAWRKASWRTLRRRSGKKRPDPGRPARVHPLPEQWLEDHVSTASSISSKSRTPRCCALGSRWAATNPAMIPVILGRPGGVALATRLAIKAAAGSTLLLDAVDRRARARTELRHARARCGRCSRPAWLGFLPRAAWPRTPPRTKIKVLEQEELRQDHQRLRARLFLAWASVKGLPARRVGDGIKMPFRGESI